MIKIMNVSSSEHRNTDRTFLEKGIFSKKQQTAKPMSDWTEVKGRRGGTVWINNVTGRMTKTRPKESQKSSLKDKFKKLIGETVSWFDGDNDGRQVEGVVRQVSGENLKIEVDGKMWWRHYSVVIGEEKTSNLGAPALKVAPSKDMYASPSFKDVTVKPMPWKRVSSLAVSSSGTSGVVFVRFGEKDGVAVRGVRVVSITVRRNAH